MFIVDFIFIHVKSFVFIYSTPTTLDHYLTSLRDPIFWKLNKKIVKIIDNALSIIPTYTRSELYFAGVKIINVDIKKLSTSFDNFEFDVTDALKPLDSDSTFQIKISQPRLKHKPFTIKVNVTSLVAQKGLMKVFLGPKMLPGELALKQDKFMLLDTCEITLKKGGNIITRTSEEISNLSPDFMSLKALHQNLEDAEFGIADLPIANIQSLTGFPSRLIIPKGTEDGLPLQIFIFVAPFAKVNIATSGTEFNSAILSPSFPLDLTISDNQLFDLPNVLVTEVILTHKSNSGGKYEGGKSKTWNSETYDYTARKGEYVQKSYAGMQAKPNQEVKYSVAERNTVENTVSTQKPSSYLLQLRPYGEAIENNSKRQYDYSNYFDSKRPKTASTYKALQGNEIKNHPMLEKKPFNISTKQDINKYPKKINGSINFNIEKNKNDMMSVEADNYLNNKSFSITAIKDINQNYSDDDVVSINISKNWDKKMMKDSAESNKGYVTTDAEDSKSFNISVDKPKHVIIPIKKNSNKLIKVKIDKGSLLVSTEKAAIKDDDSVISRKSIHENIEDIIGKYYPSELKQEAELTKKIPAVYDYIFNGDYDYDATQPKVYE